MEDVLLHYRPGSAAGLSSLVETTEKLMESFPRRTPPVFTPWFPSAADRHLPIRPAKPAPIITCPGDLLVSESRPNSQTAQNDLQKPADDCPVAEGTHECPNSDDTRTQHRNPQNPKDDICTTETPNHPLPSPLFNKPDRETTRLSSEKHKDGRPAAASMVRRSWSVFKQKGVLLQSSQSMSKQFHHMVSIHRLHLRQRVRWVIGQPNCGATRDIEEVWETLSRSVWSSRLPTCNANIQRERAEIWVFCDVVHSEQVGRLLKDELQLSGRISLSVLRLGNIFSM